MGITVVIKQERLTKLACLNFLPEYVLLEVLCMLRTDIEAEVPMAVNVEVIVSEKQFARNLVCSYQHFQRTWNYNFSFSSLKLAVAGCFLKRWCLCTRLLLVAFQKTNLIGADFFYSFVV